MTRVFLCDVSQAPLPPPEVLKTLPADRLERVTSALSREKAKQLAFVWLLLRWALRRMGYDPELLRHVRRTVSGKPMLKQPLWFSLSHSDGWVACAVSDQGSVGIDVQGRRDIPPRFYLPWFSPADQAWLREHPDDFCPLWARKESVLKCIGTGWTEQSKQNLNLAGCPPFIGGKPLSLRGEWAAPDCYLAVCADAACIPAPEAVRADEIGKAYV